MRIYSDETETQLVEVACNMCRKQLEVENGILKEGCFSASAAFGYFSEKDGQLQQFDLCEECYDRLLEKFRIPVQIKEIKELL